MPVRPITDAERSYAGDLLGRARDALREAEEFEQDRVDRLCQAIGWAVANERTFERLVKMSVDESGVGDRVSRMAKRFRIEGILRDVLREKSVGVVEEIPERGIVKYAKPVGVIASLIPMTNPELTPPSVALFAVKARDAVIFSPHPRCRGTVVEVTAIMRAALRREGAPEDLLQCVESPSIPLAQHLMGACDLVQATGGPDMVRAAYSSGTPAYGVGAGNATMIIDETADLADAARNSRISKTADNGSGCSCDGNLIIEATIYEQMLNGLVNEGGFLVNPRDVPRLEAVLWDEDRRRTIGTIAVSALRIAELAGIAIPSDRSFLIVERERIGQDEPFSGEKLSPVLATYRYSGFENALTMMRELFEVGGKGHSCGIYSWNDSHIEQLALVAPVSRIMVRQPQAVGNAGSVTNGMPMTASLGCGTWGGNITSENVHLKHYMNLTWVSRPIAEDSPSEQELFGEFYGRTEYP